MIAEILIGTFLFNASKPPKKKKKGEKEKKADSKKLKLMAKRKMMQRREAYRQKLKKDRERAANAWADFRRGDW